MDLSILIVSLFMHKAYYGNLPASLQCYFKKKSSDDCNYETRRSVSLNFSIRYHRTRKILLFILYGLWNKINDEGKKKQSTSEIQERAKSKLLQGGLM